ncbi:hypothetical protein IT575_03005 [bacterium]|nr:hypothetical protein [bacterium]
MSARPTERWNEIADPAAARVARLLWVMIPRVRGRFGVTWPLLDRPDEPQRLELRRALEASDLARVIMASPESIEDIRPRLQGLWRNLALRYLKLDYGMRLFLLGLYLDWYLGLSRELPAERLQTAPLLKAMLGLPVLFTALALVACGLYFNARFEGALWPVALLFGAALLSAAYSVWNSILIRRQWPRFLALYHYFCDYWQGRGDKRPDAGSGG